MLALRTSQRVIALQKAHIPIKKSVRARAPVCVLLNDILFFSPPIHTFFFLSIIIIIIRKEVSVIMRGTITIFIMYKPARVNNSNICVLLCVAAIRQKEESRVH